MLKKSESSLFSSKTSTLIKRTGTLALLATLALHVTLITHGVNQPNSGNGLHILVGHAEASEIGSEHGTDIETESEQEVTSELEELNSDVIDMEESPVEQTKVIDLTEEAIIEDEAPEGETEAENSVSQDNTTDLEQEEEQEDEEVPTIKVDKSELTSLISQALGYAPSDYTADSFMNLKSNILYAEGLITNEETTEEDIAGGILLLQVAIDKLKEREQEPVEIDPNRVILESLIAKAKNSDANLYTKDAFEQILYAIEGAEALLARDEASEERIVAAIVNLQNKMEGKIEITPSAPVLDTSEEKDVVLTPPQNVSNNLEKDTPMTGEVSSAETDEVQGHVLPKTATPTFSIILIGFIAFLSGGLGLILSRKRNA